MNIILIGPPGSGKGTQSDMISEKYNIPHIATGDLLREIAQGKTELGIRVKKIMAEGKLIPDDIVINLIEQRITDKGFVLDGFPRTLNQAKMLDKITGIDAVLFFDLPDKEAVSRLSKRRQCRKCNRIYTEGSGKCECGGDLYHREDDKEDAIRERLKVYHKETKPLLEHYKSKLKSRIPLFSNSGSGMRDVRTTAVRYQWHRNIKDATAFRQWFFTRINAAQGAGKVFRDVCGILDSIQNKT